MKKNKRQHIFLKWTSYYDCAGSCWWFHYFNYGKVWGIRICGLQLNFDWY